MSAPRAPSAARPSSDDEVRHGVAARCAPELAGDPLQALDSQGGRLGGLSRRLLRAVDQTVRDREGDPAGQLRRDLDIGRSVVPIGPDDEEHRPDRLAARDERLDDRASCLHRVDDRAEGLVVRGIAAKDLRVREVVDQDRPTLLDDTGARSRRSTRGRKVTDRIEDGLVVRILGQGGDPAEAPVRLDEIDEAPVRQCRYRQRGRRLDRLVQVARLVEPEARIGDEAGDVGCPFPLLDVEACPDEPEKAAVGAIARRSDVQDPPIRAVVASQAVLDLETFRPAEAASIAARRLRRQRGGPLRSSRRRSPRRESDR